MKLLIIIGQVLNVGCACSCQSRSTRNLFNKDYILAFLLVLVNEGSSLEVRIKGFDLGFE